MILERAGRLELEEKVPFWLTRLRRDGTVHDRRTHNNTFDCSHIGTLGPDRPDKKSVIMRARNRM